MPPAKKPTTKKKTTTKKSSTTKKKTPTKLTAKTVFKTKREAETNLPKGWIVKPTKGGYIQMKKYAYMKEAEKRKSKALNIHEIDIEHAIMRHENQSEKIDGNKIARELWGKKVTPNNKGKITKVFSMMKRRNWIKKKAKLEF